MEKTVPYMVRNFQKGDEYALAKIFSECFGPVAPGRIREWLRSSNVNLENVFLAVVDGKVVSHVDVEFKQLHHGEGVYLKTAGIGGVCTDSDYRNRGIVTSLLKLALDHGQQNGVSNASLFTGLNISAHRLYQRFGFVDIMTWRNYTKYIDYSFIFTRWLRHLNRSLKEQKMVTRGLKGWQKTVVAHLKGAGTFSFKYRRRHFQRLKKPPKRVDMEFSTDLQTYSQIMQGVVQWEDAVKTGKLTVKRGGPADIEILNHILRWDWGD